MNVVIAIVITAGLSVLVGFFYGNERYKEGFKRGELKEKRKSLAIYENGYDAGRQKGKEEALQENQVIETVTFSDTVMLHRTETVTLEEENETKRSREELIEWHRNHICERIANDAKRAIYITVKEPNEAGETEIEGRLVVTLRGVKNAT